MTEVLVIVAGVVFGGLITRYVQTHPFYRHKSQKHKNRFQSVLHHKLSSARESGDAYWLSRALSDHIFDFGSRTYHDFHVERYEKYVKSEINHVYDFRIESPNNLCTQLVERAIELKVSASIFRVHMRNLWKVYLVPSGRLTPKSIERISGSSVYYAELLGLPASKADMELFMKKHDER